LTVISVVLPAAITPLSGSTENGTNDDIPDTQRQICLLQKNLTKSKLKTAWILLSQIFTKNVIVVFSIIILVGNCCTCGLQLPLMLAFNTFLLSSVISSYLK